MIQIRKNVFETNSSSTHSMVIAMADDFDKWEKGETYYCRSYYGQDNKFKEGNFYPKDAVHAYYEKLGQTRDTYDFCTYDEFCDTWSLEVDTHSFTTPSGEKIVTVCTYGYEG